MPDYTTKANCKSYMAITDATDDTLIDLLIKGVTAAFNTYMGRPGGLVGASYTERYDGNGQAKLFLNNYPVTAVASLTVDGVAIPQAASSQGSGYLFSKFQLYLIPGTSASTQGAGFSVFTKGFQNVVVTYTSGYTACPDDIAQAALEQTCYLYKQRDRFGLNSKNLGGAETDSFLLAEFLPQTRMVLNAYRKLA